jgi:hypothetical protein
MGKWKNVFLRQSYSGGEQAPEKGEKTKQKKQKSWKKEVETIRVPVETRGTKFPATRPFVRVRAAPRIP